MEIANSNPTAHEHRCLDPQAQDRLRRLLDYIGEQLKDIDPRGFRIDPDKEFELRPATIASLPGVELDIKSEGDHVWLRVPRIEATRPPLVPEAHRGAIRVSTDPGGPGPRIDEAAFKAKLAKAAESLSEDARQQLEERSRELLQQALETYSLLWMSWAEAEKPRRATIRLYGKLFALKHTLESAETARPIEMVWGIGIATRRLTDSRGPFDYEYPVLTHAVELSIDEDSMAIEVRPRAVDTHVELDAFVACGIQGAADVDRNVREQLRRQKERQITPFDPSSYTDVLRLVARSLDSEGRYLELTSSREPVPPPEDHLVVTDSWVIFVRPRNSSVLLEDLGRLKQALAQASELPCGPAALVTPPSDTPVRNERVSFRGLSSRANDHGPDTEELYFPLPYNQEQVAIVEQLERSAGVTVQGPPGTGKTHTIANIICHYLATGRRVLVTSKGEPALAVLQEKFPEEIRPLTVALLANDREGLRQFQTAIEAIQHRVSQLNVAEVERRIATVRQKIDRAHSERARIDRRIDEIALTQLSDLELDGRRLRAQAAAQLIIGGQQEHGWFDDTPGTGPEHAPPLDTEAAQQLRDARRRLGRDLKYVHADLPDWTEFPAVEEISRAHEALCGAEAIRRKAQDGEMPALAADTGEVLELAREMLPMLERAISMAAELERQAPDWGLTLRGKLRTPSWRAERDALQALFGTVDELREARAFFLQHPIEIPEAALTCEKTRAAVRRAVQTGKPFGALTFGTGRAREWVAEIRVSGLPPANREDWSCVERWLDLHPQLKTFAARWNHCASALDIPLLDAAPNALRRIEELGTIAQMAHTLAVELDPQLESLARRVFKQPPLDSLHGKASDLENVRDCLLEHLKSIELSQAATIVSAFHEKLAGHSGDIVEQLSELASDIGRSDRRPEDVTKRYTRLLRELQRLNGLAREFRIVRDATRRIESAGAPRFADRLRTVPVKAAGDDPVFPVRWIEAWHWARLRSHLDSIDGADELRWLATERARYETMLAKLYQEVVAHSAWLATKKNASHKVMQALAGYATAMRRIGKGTGPNAVRYRRDAQEAMQDAAGAIPCWIMSHFKVSETIPARLGAFDLVIVDEASQSDLSAIPAILRGKRILVVGDDKQVSPDASFIDSEHIQDLSDRFLTGQPYRSSMTPEKSLYDLAARVFAGEQIMLREHFRCVPPIIAYSNHTFYQGAIAPLRIPKASERLDPPLVDIYVPEGVRDHHDCNIAEAEAIAAEINAIIADPKFARRTIGVVSLLGMEQAKRIDEVVRERCDAAELHRRRFECGDARTFQGSERDIMFLSLVVDRRNCWALSGNRFEQRFNVAASRARDRMYLVRSVELKDLSEHDLRRTLLTHFRTPIVTGNGESGALIERCESDFEREVFRALTERGYRVIPQVRTGAYRIDLVVEGEEDKRLAIECDGDELHGPDRWDHDMRRQRTLERAGWTFWRCFASTWILRRDEVLNELLEKLSAMGIEPIGSAERIPSLVESRVWRQSKTDPEEAETLLSATAEATG